MSLLSDLLRLVALLLLLYFLDGVMAHLLGFSLLTLLGLR